MHPEVTFLPNKSLGGWSSTECGANPWINESADIGSSDMESHIYIHLDLILFKMKCGSGCEKV